MKIEEMEQADTDYQDDRWLYEGTAHWFEWGGDTLHEVKIEGRGCRTTLDADAEPGFYVGGHHPEDAEDVEFEMVFTLKDLRRMVAEAEAVARKFGIPA